MYSLDWIAVPVLCHVKSRHSLSLFEGSRPRQRHSVETRRLLALVLDHQLKRPLCVCACVCECVCVYVKAGGMREIFDRGSYFVSVS